MIRESIEVAIKEALQALGAREVAFTVERPGQIEHGDYATNAALAAGKILKKNPKELAGLLLSLLSSNTDIEKVEVAGAGFINFFLSREAVAQEITKAATDPAWGNTSIYGSKKVMVEYTDPNPFKEFHIGHLMSNAIGESVARVLESAGAKVTRANYQGDVGLHVAKAIWGKQQKPEMSWGDAYVYGSTEYEAHKPEIDAINKQVYEKSDVAVNDLYTKVVKSPSNILKRYIQYLAQSLTAIFLRVRQPRLVWRWYKTTLTCL